MVDVIAVLMLVTGAMAFLYPWTPKQPLASKLIHIPLALIPLWITYEVLMPDHMNIRVDLFFIPPFLLLVLAIWAIKVARFRKLKQNQAEQGSKPPTHPAAHQ